MATKFKIWIDTPVAGTNIQSYADFNSDNQRVGGFATGVSASSIRVNSAIRQANLVAVALMETILPNSQLDLTSDVEDLIDEMEDFIDTLATKSDIQELEDSLGDQVTYTLTGTTLSITTKE